MAKGKGNLEGGARIKSVQRGLYSATWGIGQTVKTVTISAVDVNKTFEKITGMYATNVNWGEQAFRIELINSTTLQFTRTASSSSVAVQLGWEIVEYHNVKSKQSGIKSFTNPALQTQTITAVDLNKTMYNASSSTSSSTNAGVSYLQNSTTIAFQTDGGTTSFAWQVLEFN